MIKYTEDDLREELKTKEYEYGFYTDKEGRARMDDRMAIRSF
jgi:FKBP-type peptidyl-prolyl cis-trans isomerase (trigger factor)